MQPVAGHIRVAAAAESLHQHLFFCADEPRERLLVAFLLLLLGEWLGWRGNLPINAAKTSILILLTAGYSVLLWFIYRRGIPGRMLACCCVALFIASMSIFLVS